MTASAAYKILAGSKCDYDSLLNEKVVASSDFKVLTGKACMHGITYEQVAQYIYEKTFKVKIDEYGCIQHKDISYILSSPDGIVNFVEEGGNPNMLGRMLEIKCPYSRVLNGFPIYPYFVQCQLQLEVCDLEYCDFYECVFKEYTEHEFLKEYEQGFPEYYGCIVQYTDGDTKNTEYFYPKNEEFSTLRYRVMLFIESLLTKQADIQKFVYWVLKQNVVTTIQRDREWFKKEKGKLTSFWEDVLKKRTHINSAITLDINPGITLDINPGITLDINPGITLDITPDITLDITLDIIKPDITPTPTHEINNKKWMLDDDALYYRRKF